jgi:hypothetical protein
MRHDEILIESERRRCAMRGFRKKVYLGWLWLCEIVSGEKKLPRTVKETPAERRCYFCRGVVAAEALKCCHCGEVLDEALRLAEESRRSARIVVNNNNPGI